jgi:hypothetical protein
VGCPWIIECTFAPSTSNVNGLISISVREIQMAGFPSPARRPLQNDLDILPDKWLTSGADAIEQFEKSLTLNLWYGFANGEPNHITMAN